MKEGFATIVLVVVALAAITAASFGLYWVFAPARVAIDNRVFHESQSYNDGMARDLDNMRLEYARASNEGKTAIRATIQYRFAGYDQSRLPAHLQLFLSQVNQ